VEPLSIGVRDIFALLNDDELRAEFSSWPGHRQAERAYAEHRTASGASASGWKDYYRRQFGVDISPDTCARIAEAMSAKGRKPSMLRALVEDLERLGVA
jgi:hypothetical protein